MSKLANTLLMFVIASALILAGACKSSNSPPSTTTQTTTAPTTTPTSSPAAATFGQYSDAGKTVFADHCAKCHGANGEGITGPKLIGTGNNLPAYKTAQGLFNFFSTAMPLDAPASLTQTQYLQLLSFILVQNNYVSATASFDAIGGVPA